MYCPVFSFLPIVPMWKRKNGAGVGWLLAQRGEHRELRRAAQELDAALERCALHLQRSRIPWNDHMHFLQLNPNLVAVCNTQTNFKTHCKCLFKVITELQIISTFKTIENDIYNENCVLVRNHYFSWVASFIFYVFQFYMYERQPIKLNIGGSYSVAL